MRIEWTKLALERILDIAEFRFPDDAARAQTWMGTVIEHADTLRTFPNRGRPVMRDPGQHVRRLLFKDVWIVYEVHKERVVILTIRPQYTTKMGLSFRPSEASGGISPFEPILTGEIPRLRSG